MWFQLAHSRPIVAAPPQWPIPKHAHALSRCLYSSVDTWNLCVFLSALCRCWRRGCAYASTLIDHENYRENLLNLIIILTNDHTVYRLLSVLWHSAWPSLCRLSWRSPGVQPIPIRLRLRLIYYGNSTVRARAMPPGVQPIYTCGHFCSSTSGPWRGFFNKVSNTRVDKNMLK